MRTIIITGASDGIGAATARTLSTNNDRLILVGRTREKLKAVAESIGAEYQVADYAHLDEVRDLARSILDSTDRIDILANNAGGLFQGPIITDDGFELTFQVNHLAPYLLTHLLIDQLVASKASVIATSSMGARIYGNIDFNNLQSIDGFRSNKAYGDAKLANILFTKALHQRYHASGLNPVAYHPGVVATNFASENTGAITRLMYQSVLKHLASTPAKGGERLGSFITGTPGVTWKSGEFYGRPGRVARTNRQAYDPEVVQRHWEVSADMLGIIW